jgi:hypothetical protein
MLAHLLEVMPRRGVARSRGGPVACCLCEQPSTALTDPRLDDSGDWRLVDRGEGKISLGSPPQLTTKSSTLKVPRANNSCSASGVVGPFAAGIRPEP